MSDIPTPEVWNPLEHGIQGVPLMIPAHEFNRIKSGLERQLADARETIAMYQESKSHLPQRESQSSLRRQPAEMEQEVTKLRGWKESQLSVEKSWDPQAVAKSLGFAIGTDIRPNILPAIEKMKTTCEDLKRQLAESRAENQSAMTALSRYGAAFAAETLSGSIVRVMEVVDAYRSKTHDLERQLTHARNVLSRILADLPHNRDWLDPAVEREARDIVNP